MYYVLNSLPPPILRVVLCYSSITKVNNQKRICQQRTRESMILIHNYFIIIRFPGYKSIIDDLYHYFLLYLYRLHSLQDDSVEPYKVGILW